MTFDSQLWQFYVVVATPLSQKGLCLFLTHLLWLWDLFLLWWCYHWNFALQKYKKVQQFQTDFEFHKNLYSIRKNCLLLYSTIWRWQRWWKLWKRAQPNQTEGNSHWQEEEAGWKWKEWIKWQSCKISFFFTFCTICIILYKLVQFCTVTPTQITLFSFFNIFL